MKVLRHVLPITTGLLCSLLAAQQPMSKSAARETGDGSTYITHVTVIDTETGKEAQDRTVVISRDRITEVRDSKGAKPPEGAKVVDGKGKYLIPGLWDMHVHIWHYESTYSLYIANGVTGVREMFGPPDANKFRRELTAKAIVAPHFYLASPIVDGHPAVWPNSIEVTRAEQAKTVVEEQKQKGADFIKVYSRLSREAYFAIATESARAGIPFEGHVPTRITAWEASDAKQRTFEHLYGIAMACSSRDEELQPKLNATLVLRERYAVIAEATRFYSPEKCSRLFPRLKANENWQVPTLTVLRSFGYLKDPQFGQDARLRYFRKEYRDWLAPKDDFRLKDWNDEDFALQRKQFEFSKKLVGAMFRAGVPLLAGTDTGNPYCFPGFSLHDELALLVESGLSPLAALQSATVNAAKFMNTSDRYGTIAPGKTADLVLLNADPLQDIHNTTKIAEVFLAGTEFTRRDLDAILRAAETAANAQAEQSMTSQGNTESSTPTAANDVELRTAMAKRLQAMIDGDEPVVDRMTAKEYAQTDILGHVQDKPAWMSDYFRPLAALIKVGKFRWERYDELDVRVTMLGDTAVVTGESAMKGTGAKVTRVKWEEGAGASIEGTFRFTRVWIKRDGTWLLAALHNSVPMAVQTSPAPKGKG